MFGIAVVISSSARSSCCVSRGDNKEGSAAHNTKMEKPCDLKSVWASVKHSCSPKCVAVMKYMRLASLSRNCFRAKVTC